MWASQTRAISSDRTKPETILATPAIDAPASIATRVSQRAENQLSSATGSEAVLEPGERRVNPRLEAEAPVSGVVWRDQRAPQGAQKAYVTLNSGPCRFSLKR